MNIQAKKPWQKITARILIGVVLFFNLQSALLFITQAERFAPSFEVAGVAGNSLVRGMGILFVMWNVPYGFALWNPIRYHTSLIEAVMMQTIGLVGESILLATLPPGHALLTTTTNRFIVFDGFGLLALLVALRISTSIKQH